MARGWLGSVLGLLLLASCDSKTHDNAPPNVLLSIDTTTVSFSDTFVNRTRTVTLTLTNQGVAPAQITQSSGLNAPYSVVSPASFPATVAALGTLSVSITFAPTAEGTFSDLLLLTTSDPQHPNFLVTVSGRSTLGDVASSTVAGLFFLSRPVRLNDTRAVFWTAGPDLFAGNADDLLVYLDDSGTIPVLTSYTVGYAVHRLVRADDARVYATGPGPDLTFGTLDDELRRINTVPTNFSVSTITVGPLDSSDISAPVFLASTRAAVLTGGAGTAFGTGDEELKLVEFSPSTTVTISLGSVPVSPIARPGSVEDRDVGVSLPGADATYGTSDDRMAIVEYGGGNISTSLLTILSLGTGVDPSRGFTLAGSFRGYTVGAGADGISGNADDLFIRIYPSSAIVQTNVMAGLNSQVFTVLDAGVHAVLLSGTDTLPGTSDDVLRALSFPSLPGTLTTSDLAVSGLSNDTFSEPTGTTSSAGTPFLFVSAVGPDGTATTSDDRLFRIESPYFSPATLSTALGPLSGASAPPAVLSSTIAAVSAMGVDASATTTDDGIWFVDFSVSPVFTLYRDIAGLASSGLSRSVALDSRNVLLAAAGSDLTFGTADDRMVRVRIPPP